MVASVAWVNGPHWEPSRKSFSRTHLFGPDTIGDPAVGRTGLRQQTLIFLLLLEGVHSGRRPLDRDFCAAGRLCGRLTVRCSGSEPVLPDQRGVQWTAGRRIDDRSRGQVAHGVPWANCSVWRQYSPSNCR